MASSINYSSIDETFPIAGKDNDSQGFRDNFGYIKNSLQSAKGEIETLQETTAKTSTDNVFNHNKISQAAFIDCSEIVNQLNNITGTATIDYSLGQLVVAQLTANTTITLSSFPSETLAGGRLRVHLTSQQNQSTQQEQSFTATFQVSGGTIKKNTMFNGYTGSTVAQTLNPVTVSSSSSPVIIDFWTYDGGTTVFMDLVGKFT